MNPACTWSVRIRWRLRHRQRHNESERHVTWTNTSHHLDGKTRKVRTTGWKEKLVCLACWVVELLQWLVTNFLLFLSMFFRMVEMMMNRRTAAWHLLQWCLLHLHLCRRQIVWCWFFSKLAPAVKVVSVIYNTGENGRLAEITGFWRAQAYLSFAGDCISASSWHCSSTNQVSGLQNSLRKHTVAPWVLLSAYSASNGLDPNSWLCCLSYSLPISSWVLLCSKLWRGHMRRYRWRS